MAKMMKPEVKAVRFGGADVIATSSGLSSNGSYFAMKSETDQAKQKEMFTYKSTDSDLWGNASYITFLVNEDGSLTHEGWGDDANAFTSYYYAWYDNSNSLWKTENRSLSYYQNNSLTLPQ